MYGTKIIPHHTSEHGGVCLEFHAIALKESQAAHYIEIDLVVKLFDLDG